MSNTGKMDTSAVFEMFETINKKLDRQTTDKPAEPVQVDLTALNTLTKRLKSVIETAREPTQVEHQHRHSIDIHSNWFFFSWVILVVEKQIEKHKGEHSGSPLQKSPSPALPEGEGVCSPPSEGLGEALNKPLSLF